MMPARDRYHKQVRNALVADGWTITHDPLSLKWGTKDMYVDLGAEQLLAAQKGTLKIAVEIKSFLGPSSLADLEQAVGQYVLYYDVLENVEPDRHLYLAVNEETFTDLFEEPVGKLLLDKRRIRLIVFDAAQEVIRLWTPEPPAAL